MFFSQQLFDAMHRKKSISQARFGVGGSGDETTTTNGTTSLKRSLTAVDLILYGLGSAVGAGIYILAGIGAKLAGPAITVSFLGCGLSCCFTAFAYAEFSSLIPVSGSAYIYTYVAFGEIYAFCIGWNLILGYGFTASVAARGWADYVGDFLVKVTGQEWIITYLTEVPLFGEDINYTCSPLSTVIVGISTLVLLRGAKDSSSFNNIICIINLSILALVVISAMATGSISQDNLIPFAPSGVPGILRGAGLVFYAFIGFDMVASLSEEVVHPERNMPIGIIGSLVLSTLIYCGVTLAVVGMTPLQFLGEKTPLVNAILANACCTHMDQIQVENDVNECLRGCQVFESPMLSVVSKIVSNGAGLSLFAACFTSLMGQPRIFYRMAQDGLWFKLFARINPETQTMSEGIIMTGFVAALIACFVPLEALANLISLGTLMVFTFVDAGLIILRLESVAKISYETLNSEEMDEAKMTTCRNQKRVVNLLLLFTTSILGASFILSNRPSSPKFPILLLSTVALICGILIAYTPNSWTRKHRSTSSSNSSVYFECPLFPAIPLCGVALNTLLMGSLPFSSWLLCALWLTFGLVIYFNYGIKQSKLGDQSVQNLDTDPLIDNKTDYKSIGQ